MTIISHQEAGKQEKNQISLLTIDEGNCPIGENNKQKLKRTNHAHMAISSKSNRTGPQNNPVDPESCDFKCTTRMYLSTPITSNEKAKDQPPEEHGYIDIFDSGCLGHMTGNKDQLRILKKINGGTVTFWRIRSPRAWYATLSTYLENMDNKRGKQSDKTLFIKRYKKISCWFKCDDIIFGSTKKSWCDEFEALMKSIFQMSSMGELTFFLGLQVKQNKAGIFISQDKYVAEILKKFDLVNVKTAITPMETKVALTKDEEVVDVDVHLYRSMIGSLMYLTASRPDIMYAVCVCSRFQVTPKTSHLNAVKRIFKYLKGKPHLGLWYPRESPFDLEAFSDSDYGGSNLDRKSTTGGCQFLGQRLISWQCKKQTIVATSTTEAEYVAAANCCGQVLWVQNQLLDYGFNFMNTKIHIDNESTICIVKNPVYHSKTKHIEIRHHFIRDCYEKKLISVEKIHTDLNVADLLTKPFDGPRFNYLVGTSRRDKSPNTLEAPKTLASKRIAEEEELNEQQKKRRAQVQFEAQHYTDEDWDLIRAKIKANAELSKSVLGSDLQGEDFAKKMVELVNQRKKHFAEERARAKRNKPMTQSQLRTYMMNYLKNQGTWKLSQLKNLSFEEVKEEFDKLVKQVESFAPINFEATKDSLKRFGEELQTKTSKRLKSDEAKDDEPTKKTGKRRKQMARKGLHTDLDKDDS
ncbi:putative ribonuclease H-like domain-containing protein [Tanacetum coccineum]